MCSSPARLAITVILKPRLRVRGAACDVGALEFVPCSGKPPKPALYSPAQGSTVKLANSVLDWVGPDCAVKWKLQVRDGSPTGTLAYQNNNVPDSLELPTGLAHGHTYSWQVRACNVAGCGSGDWG